MAEEDISLNTFSMDIQAVRNRVEDQIDLQEKFLDRMDTLFSAYCDAVSELDRYQTMEKIINDRLGGTWLEDLAHTLRENA